MVEKVRKRTPGCTKVSSKNQITIPVAALAEAHLAVGDELAVRADGDGRLVIERVEDPLDKYIGCAPGLSAATNLQALRDEWER